MVRGSFMGGADRKLLSTKVDANEAHMLSTILCYLRANETMHGFDGSFISPFKVMD